MSDHQPITADQIERMNTLAGILDEAFNGDVRPKKVGFALLTYNFGDVKEGRVNYIGYGERADVLKALKELVGRWEGVEK